MSAAILDAAPRIRRMVEEDVDAVMEIERRAYPFPWTPGIFRDCLRVGYNAWVYVQKEQILGYALMSCGGGEAHLLNICVDPEYQGAGLGRTLLQHVLRHAGRLGADQLFLEVRPSNTRALALYEDMGFIEVGRRKGYYPAERGREDALVLARYIPHDD
ncbi:MAG TPA: ribosomal protein S18-alanine N-acetyltransferase [Gammaproteobacteria bacterium]|nr:ribosomal protein S18-alanine N-acetyltransferase [Gammaproteobacteria bacterium]